jgi:hypothetical protein
MNDRNMNASGCAEARISLGAYVLGALDPAERGRVEAHLAGCADCREELASLAALPGLLGRVSRAEVEAVPAPPPADLLDRLLVAAARERRHDGRVRRLTSVAAAVVVVAAAGAVIGVSQARQGTVSETAGASRTFVATDPVTHVTATVKEVQKGWGALVQFKLSGISVASYLGGYQCQLVAVGAGGRTDVAASWAAPAPGHDIVAIGSTAIAASDITSFKVTGSDGRTLITVPADWTG